MIDRPILSGSVWIERPVLISRDALMVTTILINRIVLPTVITAAKVKYLEALGFERSAATADEPTDLVDRLTRGYRPPKVAPETVSEINPQETPSSSHFVWLDSDGEWGRRMQSTVLDPRLNSSDGSPTLAGTVGYIDSTVQLDDVWARYKDAPTQEDRDQLIVYYAPLVKFVASRIAAGLPQNVDQADLVSYGMFGLIDAITKFDPGLGFKFETYAIARIKGAVLDELRSIDWVPRSVRAKAKSVERAMTKLEAQFHRSPTDEEIAEELDLTMGQLTNLYNQISSLGIVALDEMLSFGGGDNVTLGDTLADRREGPGSVYERVEMRQMLAEAINKMSEREKIVLTLYYYENLTLAEIGTVLGVTESRVCQIHTKAVLHLRSRLSAAEREVG